MSNRASVTKGNSATSSNSSIKVDASKPILFLETASGCIHCRRLKEDGTIEKLQAAAELIGCEFIEEADLKKSPMQSLLRPLHQGVPLAYLWYRNRAQFVSRAIFNLELEDMVNLLSLGISNLYASMSGAKSETSKTREEWLTQ